MQWRLSLSLTFRSAPILQYKVRLQIIISFICVFIRNAMVHKMNQSLICVAVGTGEPGMVLGGDLSGGCWSHH